MKQFFQNIAHDSLNFRGTRLMLMVTILMFAMTGDQISAFQSAEPGHIANIIFWSIISIVAVANTFAYYRTEQDIARVEEHKDQLIDEQLKEVSKILK